MDQIKIGKFIAEKRKERGLTQSDLASKLNLTDRAISKWETGRSFPDSFILSSLCEILEISVNDLLSGEMIVTKDYQEEAEKNLLKMVKDKEKTDKTILKLEEVIGGLSSCVWALLIFIASYCELYAWIRIGLILIGLIVFGFGIAICIKIEQTAGYYQCNKCGHKYVPKYKSVLFSLHTSRTRYLKCPSCGKRSWNKKVIEK